MMTAEPGTKTNRVRRRVTSKGIGPKSRHASLTLGGIVYIAVTLFLAIGAINAQNNLLFWLFGVAIALLVVSGALSGNAMMRLRVECQKIPDGRAGQPRIIRYQLINTSRMFPLFGAIIREYISTPGRLEQLTPAVIIHLAPGQSTSSIAKLQPQSRGRHTLDRFQIESSFPFGIIRKSIRFEYPRSFVALPHRIDFKPAVIANLVAAQTGDSQPRPNCGDSTEYFGLRQYVPGDLRRKIAWKQSARRNELVVIEHAQETSPRVMIWLRKPQDFEDPALVERAIAMVGAAARQATESKYAVGIWIPWASVSLTPDTGRGQLHRIEYALAQLNLESTHAHDDAPCLFPKAGRLVQISCTHQSGGPAKAHLYADRPDTWIAAGTQLPEELTSEESV